MARHLRAAHGLTYCGMSVVGVRTTRWVSVSTCQRCYRVHEFLRALDPEMSAWQTAVTTQVLRMYHP
jgi:hypothetical protein